MKKSKRKHYIDNEEFLEAIKVYRKNIEDAKMSGKDPPRMPEYIGKCLFLIAENVASSSKYRGYSYIDEMISESVMNAIKYFHKFDPYKGINPFAYFTQAIIRSFWKSILEEKTEKYVVYKMMQRTDTDFPIQTEIYDNINSYIEDFEKKDSERKLKRKTVSEGLDKFFIVIEKNDENKE